MRRRIGISVLPMTLALIQLQAQAPFPPMGGEQHSHLGSSRLFEFQGAFWPNLHDRLYQIGQSDGAEPELCEVEPDRARGWREAVSQYRSEMADRHHRTDPLMRDIRVFLSGLERASERAGFQRQLQILREAAPAYRSCFWPEQQRLNREWVDDLLPRLATYEETLRDQLSRYYRTSWPTKRVRVDVVRYASRAGANTIVDPVHIQMSSVNPGYREWSALEMIFHEASHALVDGRSTPIGQSIVEASRKRRAEPPPNLWHALLFYTAGKTTARELAARGHADYEPYVYRGLFRRAWSAYQEPLEQHWQQYLDGSLDFASAIDRTVAASLANLEKR